jgi:hypothetical protein
MSRSSVLTTRRRNQGRRKQLRRAVNQTRRKTLEKKAKKSPMRGTVRSYERPLDPVIDPKEWDANK